MSSSPIWAYFDDDDGDNDDNDDYDHDDDDADDDHHCNCGTRPSYPYLVAIVRQTLQLSPPPAFTSLNYDDDGDDEDNNDGDDCDDNDSSSLHKPLRKNSIF